MATTNQETITLQRYLPGLVLAQLTDYLQRLDRALPGQVEGLYLHGSAGQAGFNERYSDLDMIVVLKTALDEAGLDRLEKLHAELHANYPKLKLEVHYLQWGDLGREKKDIPPHPYYKTPKLSRVERHHINPLYWWTLKYHGIALRGPSPADLAYPVDWQPIWEWNKKTLQNYWVPWTKSPRNLLSLWNDEVAYWSVLGIARLYYNLRERDVTSKEAAGKYVMAITPARYERVLQEALRIRAGETAGEAGSYYDNRLHRALDVVRFMRYMIRECQHLVERDMAAGRGR